MRINNLLITHPNVSNSAVIVYMLLCHLAEVGGKFNRRVECNIKDMIALRQMSDRTIRTAIKQLVSEGIITVQHYNHGPSKYYLCEIEDPEPPKPRKTEEKPKITAENTAAKENSFKVNNINNINNISDYQISDTNIGTDTDTDIFAAPQIRQLAPEKVEAIHKVYSQLAQWRGKKPLYIGYHGSKKIAYLPEAVRLQMSRITAEQLYSVIMLYDPDRVQGTGTAWIQAALMRPISISLSQPDPERLSMDKVASVGHVQRKKGHFVLERDYDFGAIEAMLVNSVSNANVV